MEIDPRELAPGQVIVGDNGGKLLITGEVYLSNVMPGMMAVECEFGTLYLDLDFPVQID